jgi:hypothetical protein
MQAHGYFARLLLDDPSAPTQDAEKLELSADWRAHPGDVTGGPGAAPGRCGRQEDVCAVRPSRARVNRSTTQLATI